jgi:DNA repair protein RecO (recombination protein O)
MKFLPEKESAPEVFHLFLETMKHLESARDSEVMLRIFEIRFLSCVGFGPRMDACVICDETTRKGSFSLREGGLVCPRCSSRSGEGTPLSEGALVFWGQALAMKEAKIGRVRLQRRLNEELRHLLYRYIRHVLGGELRTYQFLQRILREAPRMTAASGRN